MQRIMMEYGLCMYNRDYAEIRISMQNEGNVEDKCNVWCHLKGCK